MATSSKKKKESVKTFSGRMEIGMPSRGTLHRELAQDPAKVESEAQKILAKIALYWRNPGEFRLDYPGREFDPQYGMELSVDDWVLDKNARDANLIHLAWRQLLFEKRIVIARSDGKRFVRPLDAEEPQGTIGGEQLRQPEERKRRPRGRPPKRNADPKKDQRITADWGAARASGCRTLQDFVGARGYQVSDVRAALDRHRHRNAKSSGGINPPDDPVKAL